MKTWPGAGMRVLASLGLSAPLLVMQAQGAHANGFTQPEGSTFTSFTVRTFHNNNFDKFELEGYAEYGLQDDVTLTFKLPYAWLDN